MPRLARTNRPLMAVRFDFGSVGATPSTRRAMLAYDDSIRSSTSSAGTAGLLAPRRHDDGRIAAQGRAVKKYRLRARSEAFDEDLTADLERAGGREYAQLAILAYRQSLAAHKLVADADGMPLLLLQGELQQRLHRHRGRDLPAVPALPALQPDAGQGVSCVPVLDYAALAALEVPVRAARPGHLSAGQRPGLRRRRADRGEPDAGRGERQHAAACSPRSRTIEGNADFAAKYWPQLTQWAEYLRGQGLRPREPALHRRLRRPPRAQRQPLDQGDPGASARYAQALPSMRGEQAEGRPTIASWRSEHGRASGRRWPTTATTTASPSTSPAPGARSTTSSGTSCSA